MKRVGLMGCGVVAGYGHLPALKDNPDLELVSILEPDEKRLRSAQAKFTVPNAFTESEPFFESGLDAVVITSPAPCHRQNVLDAARHGIHVLCEKPIAMNEAEAQEMIAATNSAGLMLFTGFTYRFSAEAQKIRKLLDEHAIGDVKSLRLIYIWNCHGRYELDENGDRIEQRRRQDRMLEGGPMVDCGAHQIDLSRWWLHSEIARYQGAGAWLEEYEAPDHMYLHLDHENGAHTIVEISYSFCHTAKEPVKDFIYDLIGTEGVIRYEERTKVVELRSSKGTFRYPVPGGKNFKGMYAAFARALETGECGDLASAEDGLIATRIAREATDGVIRGRL